MIATWIWVLIPLAAIFAGVMKRWLDLKERQMQAISREAVEQAERYARQTERLEERVRVLERIATAKGTEVAEQIENLRDRG
jgi:crotonobetainyl-CoA:carnitine CoA-transferase CaiB-like acyl-CoA transferase